MLFGLSLISALTEQNPHRFWFNIYVMLFAGILAWYSETVAHRPHRHTARFSTKTGHLRFAPRQDRFWAPYAYTLVTAVGWPVMEILSEQRGYWLWRIRVFFMVFLGVAFLVETLRRQFRAPGLTLTPHGIYGVRGGERVNIAWSALYRVDAAVVPKRPKREHRNLPHAKAGIWLYLTEFGHDQVAVNTQLTATDVNVLYWTVRYFWEHPDERELLRDPAAALRRVEDFYGGHPRAVGDTMPESSEL
ncbi:hypothetical protein [Mycetocola lacteus]|uniref:hypothetical protein n=1 Tax=Mycetocola lacteus TaxID=76637 RepID=UPI0011C48E9F|nr:hypothetical protein [Mycetocola lacteus]